jgi:hypothetical protein
MPRRRRGCIDARTAADLRALQQGIAEQRLPQLRRRFTARPIRPSRNWKGDNFLGKDPTGSRVTHRPVDPALHRAFAAAIRILSPEQR